MNQPLPGVLYCQGRLKRTFDMFFSGLGLIVLSPVFIILILLQLVANGRPVMFVQQRVGIRGATFNLLKFRTMRATRTPEAQITAHGDRRITGLGRLMRASKLDELPQLVNVLLGQMALVGPRPELPDYVRLYTGDQRAVLEVRPGLTDPATLQFRDEEHLLAAIEPGHRETYYINEIMPRKLTLNRAYLEKASLSYDLLLIIRTLEAIIWRRP